MFIFVGQKDLSRSAGEQKLFDCVLIIYTMGLILFTLLTVLMFCFHCDASTKEEKGGIVWYVGEVFVNTIMT